MQRGSGRNRVGRRPESRAESLPHERIQPAVGINAFLPVASHTGKTAAVRNAKTDSPAELEPSVQMTDETKINKPLHKITAIS